MIALKENIEPVNTAMIEKFIYPDSENAYNILVYVHPANQRNSPATFLSIALPKRSKSKIRPHVIRNQRNIPWIAAFFGHSHTEFSIIQIIHFDINPSYESLFKTT